MARRIDCPACGGTGTSTDDPRVLRCQRCGRPYQKVRPKRCRLCGRDHATADCPAADPDGSCEPDVDGFSENEYRETVCLRRGL